MKIQSLSTLMLIESRAKFHSRQNISGASQQNSTAVFSSASEVTGGMAPCILSDLIHVSVISEIPN